MIPVSQIKFAIPVSRVGVNAGDVIYYNEVIAEHKYLKVYYVPKLDSFLVHNTKDNIKMYVAKTNVAQWYMNDETDEPTTTNPTRVNKTKAEKANAQA